MLGDFPAEMLRNRRQPLRDRGIARLPVANVTLAVGRLTQQQLGSGNGSRLPKEAIRIRPIEGPAACTTKTGTGHLPVSRGLRRRKL